MLEISPLDDYNPQDASPSFEEAECGFSKNCATGNWWGWRNKLADAGILMSSSYVFDVLGNPAGGKDNGICYNHSWGLDLNFDLEKMAKLKGTQFHTSAVWRSGQNLSARYIDNLFVASSIYGSQVIKLYSLYLDQSLFDNWINFRIGRIGVGDDFTAAPIYWYYVNNAIDGNPISAPINMKSYTTYPTATWGMRLKIKLTKATYIMSGLYNGDSRVGRNSAHGCDFNLKLNRGFFSAHEIGFTPNQEKDAKGMPGVYKGGIYFQTDRTDEFYRDIDGNSYIVTGRPKQRQHGNYGFYFHTEQMLYREGGPGSTQGLTPFAAATFGPDKTNKFPFFIDGGLIYKGLIPRRDDDVAIFGFAYGKFSTALANSERDDRDVNGTNVTPQRFEMMLEWSYRVQVTPWLYIQPDMQYIGHPKGTGKTKDAYVLGFRTGVTF
ncbi:MAG: carbohydrate porin [Candidatus Omnitrophica bacterium]|nr:carbohydrate porin [Candidatus Omnitrophota bacterium]